MDLLDILPLFEALKRHGADYVLVGGIAVNFHGLLRATEDVDLFVRPTADNVERLRAALFELFEDDCLSELDVEDLRGEYPTIRYGPPEADFVVDIISRLCDAVTFDDLEAEWVDVDGVPVHLATPRTLFEMKRGTIRAIDRDDAARLAHAFDLEDDAE